MASASQTGARILLGLLLVGPLLVGVASAEADDCLTLPAVDDRCEAWAVETTYGQGCCDGGRVPGFNSSRHFLATDEQLFFTIPVNDPGAPALDERWDWQTSAFSPADGALVWTQRIASADWDVPLSLAVSPDQERLYVTGFRDYPHTPNTISLGFACDLNKQRFEAASAMSVAYDASTGQELWRSGLSTPPFLAAAFDSSLSPDGRVLYQAGIRLAGDPEVCDFDAAVVALDAQTGEELWGAVVRSGSRAVPAFDAAYRVEVAADGQRAIVAGVTNDATTRGDLLAAAVNLRDDPQDPDQQPGDVLWVSAYDDGGRREEQMADMAYDPQHERVVVTGSTLEGKNFKCSLVFNATGCEQYRFATVAYDAGSGEELWRARYQGPAPDYSRDTARAMAMSPDGARVFVTGESLGTDWPDWDYATVSYDAESGQELWVERYGLPTGFVEWSYDVLVDPDGERVYVTGESAHVATGRTRAATVAYGAAGGGQLWAARYGGRGPIDSTKADQMALAPDGSRLFVSGWALETTAAATGESNRGIVFAYDLDE